MCFAKKLLLLLKNIFKKCLNVLFLKIKKKLL